MAREWEADLHDDRKARRKPRRGGSTVAQVLWGLIALLVVVGAGLAWAVFSGTISIAQNTVPNPTPRPPVAQNTAAGGTAGAAGDAQTGQTQPAQPQLTVTKTATYEDWIYQCVKLPNSEQVRCGISQQLADAKTKAPLFVWRIVQDGKGGLVGEWQTRTGIMVSRGIVLDAGTEKPITIPFELCTPQGCQAVANLADDFIAALTKAEKATATVVPIGAQPVMLALSVKGLAQGLAALKLP
jgi:invasion protein IalB